MNELVLKQASDNSYHLFGWNADKKTLEEIAEGPFANQLKTNCFLLENSKKKFNLYMLNNGELVVLPMYSEKVEFIGDICVCQHNNNWYAFIDGNEYLLGERYEITVSTEKACRCLNPHFYFFRLGSTDRGFKLSIIEKNALFQKDYSEGCGTYCQKKAFLFVSLGNWRYDVFKDGVLWTDNLEHTRYLRDDEKNVYFWHTEEKVWVKIVETNCMPIADNALLEWRRDEMLKTTTVILYRVFNAELTEIARGKRVKFIDDGLKIGGKIYSKDGDIGIVDFNNAKPTRWQKFLRLFR